MFQHNIADCRNWYVQKGRHDRTKIFFRNFKVPFFYFVLLLFIVWILETVSLQLLSLMSSTFYFSCPIQIPLGSHLMVESTQVCLDCPRSQKSFLIEDELEKELWIWNQLLLLSFFFQAYLYQVWFAEIQSPSLLYKEKLSPKLLQQVLDLGPIILSLWTKDCAYEMVLYHVSLQESIIALEVHVLLHRTTRNC